MVFHTDWGGPNHNIKETGKVNISRLPQIFLFKQNLIQSRFIQAGILRTHELRIHEF